ncbi:hypothetical protein DSCA_01520 [Desulfosarcina alkanivorans]|uniref:Uncharacterized protein n=1 Tax=Desulfosarcina alkanivorans TaxID=571177 RepID=A0A5K7YA07_9BACT|nr:hypothetical protein DSCA_01520 [Desulfosarcina alkanivorans]
MFTAPADAQKIIYNQHAIHYKRLLSLRFTIGQSKYKFKGVFHGEKESHQIDFKKEACAEKSGFKGQTEEKSAG